MPVIVRRDFNLVTPRCPAQPAGRGWHPEDADAVPRGGGARYYRPQIGGSGHQRLAMGRSTFGRANREEKVDCHPADQRSMLGRFGTSRTPLMVSKHGKSSGWRHVGTGLHSGLTSPNRSVPDYNKLQLMPRACSDSVPSLKRRQSRSRRSPEGRSSV